MATKINMDICRLCFAIPRFGWTNDLSSIRTHDSILNELAGFEIPSNEFVSDKVCTNCKLQIDLTMTLRKRLKFSHQVWMKYQDHINDTLTLEDPTPITCDSNLLMNCHQCGGNFNSKGLQAHITSAHGQEHASDCVFCSIILCATILNTPQIAVEVSILTTSTEDPELKVPLLKRKRTLKTVTKTIKKESDSNHTNDESASQNMKLKDHSETDQDIPMDLMDPLGPIETPGNFVCFSCNLSMPTLYNLLRHTEVVHQSKHPVKMPCKYCVASFSKCKAYRNHLKTHNQFTKDDLSLACNLCDKKFTDIAQLSTHIKRHDRTAFGCEQCPETFPDELSLENHQVAAHQFDPLKCTVCGHLSSRPGNMRRHMMTHTGFRCTKCPATFVVGNRLREHMQTHHSNPKKNIKIDPEEADKLLEKSTSNSVQTESVERDAPVIASNPLQCKVCGLISSKIGNLARHMLIHSGYRCKHCQASFTRRFQLEEHLKTHRKKGHACLSCNLTFETVAEQKAHRYEMHRNDQLCGICGKVVTNIDTHMLQHRQDEKTFKCSEGACGKRFHTEKQLKLHFLTHLEETPLPCDICGKVLKKMKYLKEHMKLHSV